MNLLGFAGWYEFTVTYRFLVVHDEIADITKKLEQIPGCSYDLLGHFTLPRDTWWAEYYGPLEKRINELRAKHSDEPQALLELDKEQREIDMFKANSRRYRSVFFVMQKK